RRADAWWALAETERGVPPRSDAASRYATLGQSLFQAFVSANDDFGLGLAARSARLRRGSGRLGALAVGAVATLTAAGALIAALTARRLARDITRPLSAVAEVLDRRRT